MSSTLEQIRALVARGDVRVSLHGFEELAADAVRVRDVVAGVAGALVVEDYPDYPKGRCCLALQRDGANRPIHVVWGIPAGQESPAVVVTAYRPDPARWGRDVAEETIMSTRSTSRLVRGGEFAAEVDVELVEADGGWAPYLRLEDACKLHDVRDALCAGDIARAAKIADRVYRLTPLHVSGEAAKRSKTIDRAV